LIGRDSGAPVALFHQGGGSRPGGGGDQNLAIKQAILRIELHVQF